MCDVICDSISTTFSSFSCFPLSLIEPFPLPLELRPFLRVGYDHIYIALS